MDLLTHSRKRVKYARILIEMDVAVDIILELDINLPTGKTTITFIYEHEIAYCKKCNKVGHAATACSSMTANDIRISTASPGHGNPKRNRSKSVTWTRGSSRGRSRVAKSRKHAPERCHENIENKTMEEKQPIIDIATKSATFSQEEHRSLQTEIEDDDGELQKRLDKGKQGQMQTRETMVMGKRGGNP